MGGFFDELESGTCSEVLPARNDDDATVACAPAKALSGDAAVAPAKPLSRAAQKRLERTIVSVHEAASVACMEVSAHVIASPVAMFMPHVFPEARGHERLRVVVTVQRARCDIMDRTAATEAERVRLFELFRGYAAALAALLPECAFLDHGDIDGTAVRTALGGSSFNEVEVAHSATGYRTTTIGGVTIVDHPRWGTSVYLGSIVTSAGDGDLRRALALL